jgi:sortase (surface protein transpeptidase)
VDALNARPAPNTGKGRALTVIAVIALVGAGVLAVAGVRASGSDGAVLYVDDVVASVLPSTVPPVVTTSPPVTEPAAPEATEPAPAAPAARADPVGMQESTDLLDRQEPADLVDEQESAVPEEVEPRPQPVGLQIETIDVSRFPVRDIGLEDDGQLEIPDETEIGWYKFGATAGRAGATVLAAHVNWQGSEGPFSQLGTVEPGDQIEVTLDDGTTRNYAVVERAMYDKLELPRERIWRNTGPEELVLITCGGELNPEIRSFKSNIVVYAVPIG